MSEVFLSLGSNVNRFFHIREGLKSLQSHFGDIEVSSVFESEAVGFKGKDFLNLVVGFTTSLPLMDVANICRQIEFDFGRELDAKKYSPRTLDIDILLFDDLVCERPVQLPRAEILTNAFVLWPLSEIAGQKLHPIKQQTFTELWHNYPKSNQVLKKISFSM